MTTAVILAILVAWLAAAVTVHRVAARRRRRLPIARIEQGIARLGTGLEPRPDWQDRVHEHTQMHALLVAFADGELDDDRAEQVRDHLVTCEVCQHELQEILQMGARLGALGKEPTP